MDKAYRGFDSGPRKAPFVLLAIVVIAVIILLVKALSTQAPSIQLAGKVKGIGQSTTLQFDVSDSKHRIKSVKVELVQGDQTFDVPTHEMSFGEGPPPWWKFWAKPGENSTSVSAMAGRNMIQGLKEGRATIHITALNDSWGRFFRGGMAQRTYEFPVRFTPPQVEVLTLQHYVNQGGCDMVVFKISPGTTESGVRVGNYFFPSWPVKESAPETRLCLFAYPYDVDPKTQARIVATDDAGNQTLANFTYQIFPKKFHSDTIKLTDDFMNRVVPAIMSQTPELEDQGNLLKNFLEINGSLRKTDAEELVKLSHETAPHFLWTEPFLRLPSKTEANFADARSYVYDGQVVDHQVHLGFDLAGVEHMPVQASNDGRVVHAGFLGIYGNAVIIDHGCGLQSLYGHLSSIKTKVGETVKRGQEIGVSGETGLAGGDHLHFTILLDGVPVNPIEWWDPHWIHDRIESKLASYQ
ncbi:MAG TPA: M23 family metallopeptidase [Terriglobia bacterium]|nr:M23 family metallopeptidase [Terriglobia bacterium]